MTKKEVIVVSVLVIIACVRFFFFTQARPHLDGLVSKEVSFEGIVVDDPDVRLNNQHINVKIKDIDTTLLVIVDREADIYYGDIVKVVGVLEEPENFITNSGKEFNYKRYLANEDIFLCLKRLT